MVLKNGIVNSGEYIGWSVQIIDDTSGDTGGFYLVLRSQKNEAFDYWFEKKIFLDNQLSDFDISWSA